MFVAAMKPMATMAALLSREPPHPSPPTNSDRKPIKGPSMPGFAPSIGRGSPAGNGKRTASDSRRSPGSRGSFLPGVHLRRASDLERAREKVVSRRQTARARRTTVAVKSVARTVLARPFLRPNPTQPMHGRLVLPCLRKWEGNPVLPSRVIGVFGVT